MEVKSRLASETSATSYRDVLDASTEPGRHALQDQRRWDQRVRVFHIDAQKHGQIRGDIDIDVLMAAVGQHATHASNHRPRTAPRWRPGAIGVGTFVKAQHCPSPTALPVPAWSSKAVKRAIRCELASSSATTPPRRTGPTGGCPKRAGTSFPSSDEPFGSAPPIPAGRVGLSSGASTRTCLPEPAERTRRVLHRELAAPAADLNGSPWERRDFAGDPRRSTREDPLVTGARSRYACLVHGRSRSPPRQLR
jgi:hypothetical protein